MKKHRLLLCRSLWVPAACVLILSRTAWLGAALPTVGPPTPMPTGQAGGGNPSVEVPSSRVCLGLGQVDLVRLPALHTPRVRARWGEAKVKPPFPTQDCGMVPGNWLSPCPGKWRKERGGGGQVSCLLTLGMSLNLSELFSLFINHE